MKKKKEIVPLTDKENKSYEKEKSLLNMQKKNLILMNMIRII